MPFQVSPGVNVSEIDLTTIVPAVSTTEGAMAGVFRWGPVETRVLVDTEDKLAARFGKPTNYNPETFFTAANFLAYGNKLFVSRAANVIGTSITATMNLYANSTLRLVGGGNTQLVESGFLVFGDGIPTGTTVSAANSTVVTLSVAATAGNSSGIPTTGIVFVEPTTTFSAVANNSNLADGDDIGLFVVKNEDDYLTKTFPVSGSKVNYVAKYPGELGNSLKISVCDSNTAYQSTINAFAEDLSSINSGNSTYTYIYGGSFSNAGISIASGSAVANLFLEDTGVGTNQYTPANTSGAEEFLNVVLSQFQVGDIVKVGNNSAGYQELQIASIGSPAYNSDVVSASITFTSEYTLTSNFYSSNITRAWEYSGVVSKAPGQSEYVRKFGNTAAKDEVHAVVVDEDGKFTGVPGTVLEVFEGLSRATDAKTEDGAVLYYKTVINDNSSYIWWTGDREGAASNTAVNVTSSSKVNALTSSFILGQDGVGEDTVAINALMNAYDKFKSAEDVDISLVLQGKARGGTHGTQLANYLIDNIAEYRKDCVVFVSPEKTDVVNNVAKDEAEDTVTFRNALSSTSYAVLDSGYKYQYDKYNDVYRYIPLNGDIAGLAVRTDNIRDPWWSPAGLNRGQIKNIIKLAYNPNKAQRDLLYKNDINPVCIFPGQGTVLFGDKTILGKPSAFDRINVRRLFIVLEKAIATAAKFTLFEFNDAFTRAQFKNLVEPFLRDVQGRRGIYDFKVVCDETNNTGEVIDRNEFVGDIYIKPARSINFIQLNFVAVRTGVEFSEVVGKF